MPSHASASQQDSGKLLHAEGTQSVGVRASRMLSHAACLYMGVLLHCCIIHDLTWVIPSGRGELSPTGRHAIVMHLRMQYSQQLQPVTCEQCCWMCCCYSCCIIAWQVCTDWQKGRRTANSHNFGAPVNLARILLPTCGKCHLRLRHSQQTHRQAIVPGNFPSGQLTGWLHTLVTFW